MNRTEKTFNKLFNTIHRYCGQCKSSYLCDYSCKEIDKLRTKEKRKSQTACYCPKCYLRVFGPDFTGHRRECNILQKECGRRKIVWKP